MKKAISLVELVFAIVIIGVGVAALPFMGASNTKANIQTILSEVVLSSRAFVDDLLVEPWNSTLAEGYTNEAGTSSFAGILKAENDDPRFSTKTDADGKQVLDTDKYFFTRLLAKSEPTPGITEPVSAKDIGNLCGSGLNCQNNVTRKITERFDDTIAAEIKELTKDKTLSKNALAFEIKASVNYINIDETKTGNKITATFDPSKTSGGTTNALMITSDARGEKGKLTDDVDMIVLRAFSFNIGSE